MQELSFIGNIAELLPERLPKVVSAASVMHQSQAKNIAVDDNVKVEEGKKEKKEREG